MINTSTITASEARGDLYNIIREASKGLRSFEIKLRDVEPVILISKDELEGWLETLDIMANPDEVAALEEARNEITTTPLEEVMKDLGLKSKNEKSTAQKKSRKRSA